MRQRLPNRLDNAVREEFRLPGRIERHEPRLQKVKDELYDDVVRRKWFRGRPDKVRQTGKAKMLGRRVPNPVQGKMIYGLRKLKKERLDLICKSVRELVGVMEAQDLKVTFFFDEE